MATFEYNPIAEFVILKYTCPHCGNTITSESFSVPMPDFAAENHSDSLNSETYESTCPHCGQPFGVTLNTGMFGGDGEISDVDDPVFVEEEFADDDDFDYQQWYDETHSDVEKALDSIEALPENIKSYLYKLLYASVITSMETFLGDTIKREVLSKPENIRRFVEKYEPFKSISIKLSDIYVKSDQIKSRITTELNDLMYHNLPKIKPIYKDILGINLGEIRELYKAVLVRHDLVHRNGHTKDGRTISISKENVLDISEKVQELISSVNKQLVIEGPIQLNPELMWKEE